MKTKIILLTLLIAHCSFGNAQTPTPEEQRDKIWAATHPGNDPDIHSINDDVKECSDYIDRPLRKDEWITDTDMKRVLKKLENAASIYNIIDTCAFFMPKAMQLKWVKDHLRQPYKENSTKFSPDISESRYSGKFVGLPSIPPGTILSEQQFQTMLRNAKPHVTLSYCKYFIANDQFERWLDHEALYMLNYSNRRGRERGYANGWY